MTLTFQIVSGGRLSTKNCSARSVGGIQVPPGDWKLTVTAYVTDVDAVTAAADPPELPPGTRSSPQGLWVGP